MQRQPAKGCHCTVDLQAAKPPARMVAQVTPAASLRYFGPGAAAEAVDQVIDTITENGLVPSSVNLGGTYEPSFVVEVLRHLARHWSAVPPARKQERKQTFARIHVVHDFDDVVAIIAGESKDLDFQQNIETWTVENESEGGYGAVIPDSATDWLQVGTLLGIKLADGNAWGVGIVRRLTNGANNQRYVGIQTVSKGGARVKVFPVEPKAGRGRGRRRGPAAQQRRRQHGNRRAEPAHAHGHLLAQAEPADARLRARLPAGAQAAAGGRAGLRHGEVPRAAARGLNSCLLGVKPPRAPAQLQTSTSPQERPDVVELFRAQRVRHLVLVPLHRIAQRQQP